VCDTAFIQHFSRPDHDYQFVFPISGMLLCVGMFVNESFVGALQIFDLSFHQILFVSQYAF